MSVVDRAPEKVSQLGLWVAGIVLGLGGAAWFVFHSGSAQSVEIEETPASDDRVAWLLAPCGFTLPFTADTSDVMTILVETLAHGQAEPIKYARSELAKLLPSALPALERRFEASFAQAFEQGILENVLGACTIADEAWGLDLLRRGLGHPGEAVRMGAMAGIQKHGGAEDYDSVLFCLSLTTSPQVQASILETLATLDPERFGRELSGWLKRGELPHLWAPAVLWVGGIHDPETSESLRAQADGQGEHLLPYLLAPAARAGDESALLALRQRLGDASAQTREQALRALGLVGLGAETSVVLELDSERGLRLQAAALLASLPPSADTTRWLTQGLADPDADVRGACLKALCERRDERALAEALESLRGDARMSQYGLIALRGVWAQEPLLAKRAFDFIRQRIAEEPTSEGAARAGLLQMVSQVPGQATAAYLLEQARNLRGRINGWRAHRYCVHQAINSGPEGRAFLASALADERDVLRRIDLIEAVSQDQNEGVRALLHSIIDDPAADPCERVYACYRLVRQGAWAETAPYLKRVYLASTDKVVRAALHCLLWAWYGAALER